MSDTWLSLRSRCVDSSGIRKVFDLAAKMSNPINLSIGQPDFDVPANVRDAARQAIDSGKNAYSPTQGIAPLREQLQSQVDATFGHSDRRVMVTSGTSGGLMLAIQALVDPGDEVIVFDPYFVMYPALIGLAGGTCVFIDTYPDFRIDAAKVEAALTARTKLILFNSPANPTGAVASEDVTRSIAELARQRDIAIISDEIYDMFCYDRTAASAATFNDQTIVINGFSKTHGMTGWRIGYAHGPSDVIGAMTTLQQYTYVCAPQPFQWAAVEALTTDMRRHVEDFRMRRDQIRCGLLDAGYEVEGADGAFYVYPKIPSTFRSGTEFVEEAIKRNLLIIPGGVFSTFDTHFRVSYAANRETIDRGVEVLRQLANV